MFNGNLDGHVSRAIALNRGEALATFRRLKEADNQSAYRIIELRTNELIGKGRLSTVRGALEQH